MTETPREEAVTAPPVEAETHLGEYLQRLRKHFWLILGIFLISVITAVLWLLPQKPIYQAAATLLIEPEPPRVLNIPDVTPLGGANAWDPVYYPTQHEIIRSQPVLDRALEILNQKPPGSDAQAQPAVGREVFGSLAVEPKRNTRLVFVKVESPDPVLAAAAANAVAQAYVKYNLDLKLGGARDAVGWLGEEAARLKAKVYESSVALQNYRVKSGILGLQEQRQITAQKIMDFNKAYLDAQAQRLSMEARLREINQVAQDKSGALTIFTVVDTPIIQRLKGELTDLEIEKGRALKVYKEKHPEVIKIDAKIEQVQQKIEAAIQTMLRAVETEYKVARAREETLLKNVTQLSREGQELSEKEIQYLSLQRENETNQQLYDSVLKRLKETGVTGGLETNNVRIMEKAGPPAAPIRPRRGFTLVVAVGLGLVLGLGSAAGLEYFDRSLKTPDDVERRLGLSAIAIIPKFTGKVSRRRGKKRRAPMLVAESDPKTPASEAYRTLRTNLAFAGIDSRPRTLVVTSATIGEGKTTTAANFGVVCAQAGVRVCLVDSDLRRPTLHRVFGLSNERGLTTALVDGVSFAQTAQPTRIENLSVLTSGPVPPNPSEMVGSKRMGDLLAGAAADFDLVVCDTPPLISVGDGVALAAQAEGVIVVVEAGNVPHDVVRRAVEQIDAVRGRIVGVLLNRVDLRRDGYGYGYYHYYSAYYGSENGHK
jgi:capsular exopolysaccharide synthesis family protein